MPNPSVRSSSSLTFTTATGSVTKPAGTAQGDILLAVQQTVLNTGTAPPAPTGFSTQDSITWDSGVALIQLFWKQAGGAEPGSYTFNNAVGGIGGDVGVWLVAIQNAAGTGPENDVAGTGSGTSLTTSGLTPVSNGELVFIAFGFLTAVSISAQALSDGTTITDLGTLTLAATAKLDVYYGSQVTAAAVNGSATLSGAGSPWAGMIVCLAPAPPFVPEDESLSILVCRW